MVIRGWGGGGEGGGVKNFKEQNLPFYLVNILSIFIHTVIEF